MFNKRKIELLKKKINELSERIDLMEYKAANPFKFPIGYAHSNCIVIEHVIDWISTGRYESSYKVFDTDSNTIDFHDKKYFEETRP